MVYLYSPDSDDKVEVLYLGDSERIFVDVDLESCLAKAS